MVRLSFSKPPFVSCSVMVVVELTVPIFSVITVKSDKNPWITVTPSGCRVSLEVFASEAMFVKLLIV